MDDVFEMTDKEMMDLGIKAYSLRRRLLRVIKDVHVEQPGEPISSPSASTSASASTGSLTDTTLAEETQGRLHLKEAQDSSSTRYLFEVSVLSD